MKNILIIPPFNLYPLISGGHQAIFNGISILENIANVYVLTPTTESKYKRKQYKEIENVLPFVHAVPYILPESKHTLKWYYNVLKNKIAQLFPIFKKSEKKKNKFNPLTLCSSILPIDKDKIKALNNIINKYKIDIVQSEMVINLPIVEVLNKKVKTIFVHHELKFVRDKLLLESQCLWNKDWEKRWLIVQKQEINYLNKYDEVITLSEQDSQKLKECGVTHPTITTSFAVVNSQRNNISPKVNKIEKVLTFVGPEMHYPNYDGVMWFLENCWDLLLQKDNNYQFRIIGNWDSATILKITEKYKQIEFSGFVDDLYTALIGTTMVVPLNIGSGIRMKILEAALIGVPVVTTSVGVEGLPLKNNEHCFIANEPIEFVESILRLQNGEVREQFISNTNDTISKKYSIDALRENRKHLYI